MHINTLLDDFLHWLHFFEVKGVATVNLVCAQNFRSHLLHPVHVQGLSSELRMILTSKTVELYTGDYFTAVVFLHPNFKEAALLLLDFPFLF